MGEESCDSQHAAQGALPKQRFMLTCIESDEVTCARVRKGKTCPIIELGPGLLCIEILSNHLNSVKPTLDKKMCVKQPHWTLV